MEVRRTAGTILPIASIVATLALFIAMTALQSRWVAQLSDTELQRARLRLQVSMMAVQAEINRELSRAYVLFQWPAGTPRGSLGRETRNALVTWRRTAHHPDLLQRVLLVEPDPHTPALRISVYRDDAVSFDPISWPAELEPMRRQLQLPFSDYDVFGVRTFTGVALAPSPVLLFPLGPPHDPGFPSAFPEAAAWIVLQLDKRLLLTKIVPESIRDNIEQPDRFDFQITRDGFPDQVVYRSNPELKIAKADASCTLLEARREYLFREIAGVSPRTRFPFGEDEHESVALARLHRWHNARMQVAGAPMAPPGEGGVWNLQVHHRAGSLEAAAAGMRRGNLLLGFALMALIAADIGVLAISARRAQNLGQARLQFAAAVSHELRTPLAAICSAADNLFSGIVHDPSKVRQYGAAIMNQGKHLAAMVEQILIFTGSQLSKEPYDFEVLDPREVIKQASAAVAPAASAAGIEIEEHLPPALPHILGDSHAIHRALVNLLTNAIRYAAAGRWIGVSARAAKPREIEITVADRGPGIPSADLKRIFEPFYRGSGVHSVSRGAGLGLTIVEQVVRAHGGRVTPVSVPGEGSRFTLHFPLG